jgi:hypothetical protein
LLATNQPVCMGSTGREEEEDRGGGPAQDIRRESRSWKRRRGEHRRNKYIRERERKRDERE